MGLVAAPLRSVICGKKIGIVRIGIEPQIAPKAQIRARPWFRDAGRVLPYRYSTKTKV
jgi:hypothetical protein